MKHLSRSLVLAASALAIVAATQVEAGSIGRSSSSGFSSSRSSTSSFSAPRSAPSPAPSSTSPSVPAYRQGGIGGTTGSMGVRKSEVTSQVAQRVNPPATPLPSSTNRGFGGYQQPVPSYGTVHQPAYTGPSTGGIFASSLGGSFIGSWLGNSMFGNHGAASPTIINNSGQPMQGGYGAIDGGATNGVVGMQAAPQKHYGVWSFIGDVIGFVFLICLLVVIGLVGYKGFKMLKDYWNRERGTATQPFSPTAQFWDIQNAFSVADVTRLQTLLGPDLVTEATANLTPSTITLSKVSHEVVLSNAAEFSVHYTFDDAGQTVHQVWHYEKLGAAWVLNGIENV